MVMVINNCNCGSCQGTVTPKGKKGEIVFGGTLCHCKCHTLKDEEQQKFIAERDYLDKISGNGMKCINCKFHITMAGELVACSWKQFNPFNGATEKYGFLSDNVKGKCPNYSYAITKAKSKLYRFFMTDWFTGVVR